ncbi:MAG TPA: hypothetical protein VGO47_09780, partial [Chlamydiales bacterium]|nr:hypothetical protein [Chlamydiales bacterium]
MTTQTNLHLHSYRVKSLTYKLYDSWTLDNASDVHLCNDINRSDFQKTHNAHPNSVVTSGKESYKVECYGTVLIPVDIGTKKALIQLKNVALVTGFLTNLVSLSLLNDGDLHWHSKYPNQLEMDGQFYCHLYSIDAHWVLQKTSKNSTQASTNTVFTAKSSHPSAQPKHRTLTAARAHQILGHPSEETISHLQASARDITIDNSVPCPKTIDCEVCSLSKATRVVSRSPEVEIPAGDTPFARCSWDMLEASTGYNGDQYISHFRCEKYGFHMVWTHPRKSDAFDCLNEAESRVIHHFKSRILFLKLDMERTFQVKFDEFCKTKGIVAERTAPNTHEQNGGSKRAGKELTIKARGLRIGANLPHNMWPECYRTAAYCLNRHPLKRLGWKTPFEAVFKERPMLAHLETYGGKAYHLKNNLPRKAKLEPRAHIGYLVGYDSTNIFRIWVPSQNKVIRTRDVRIDGNSLYNPIDLDIDKVLREQAEKIIETLDLPEYTPESIPDNIIYNTIIVDVPGNPSCKSPFSLPGGENQTIDKNIDTNIEQAITT